MDNLQLIAFQCFKADNLSLLMQILTNDQIPN